MTDNSLESLSADLQQLITALPNLKHGKWIHRALAVLLRITGEELERLDWKILASALEDMEGAFQVFHKYRHIRKIAIFGSARTPADKPEYKLAVDFARSIAQQGYMVMTGAGGGIMHAANEGAGMEHSFGLNIMLPFEQGANPFIEGDDKLVRFKYFFTRKLFFLKESDAVAAFPGGFGTLDETFESLTLSQTGKFGPIPIILMDYPGGNYWNAWEAYVQEYLVNRGLVSNHDYSLYTITDSVEVACQTISDFYRIYHSSRYVGDKFVIRLKENLSDEKVAYLNDVFQDILVTGKITKAAAFPEESGDETTDLPRLVLHFNQRDLGRLYQLIGEINSLGTPSEATQHPELK
jgi:uncharacterized protein (TIGR00730 family)